MNVTLNKTTDVLGTITVNVVEDDYAAKVKAELKKIGQTHRIPGFRQGHVPADQLRRRFGKQVKSDVLNHEVYNAVINYIRDNKLNVLGEPLPVEVKEVNLDEADYTFEYEIGIAPNIEVSLNKDVTLPYYEIEVSKDMIDEQNASLCERFGAQVPGEEVDEKALVKGTIMQLNEDGSVNENEGAIQVLNGIVAPMYFKSKDEAAKFIGKKVNDKVVFNPYNTCEGNAAEIASMLNIDKEIAADIKGDFEFAIAEIIVVKPAEHNQEFFDNVFGKDKVHSEEEYEKAVSDMIATSLASNSEMFFNNSAQKLLVEKYGEMTLPVEFLKKWLVARNEELTSENIDKEFEEMLPSLKWQLIKERVAQQLEVKFGEEDVLAYAKQIAYRQFAQYGITNMDEETITDTAKRILNDKNYRGQIVEQVGDIKLFSAIREAVNVENKKVSLDEFKALVQA
jgi:trigger factor